MTRLVFIHTFAPLIATFSRLAGEILPGVDGNSHVCLVKHAFLDLNQRVDAVVLAQASMARILDILPEVERPKPVFSSPHLALHKIKDIFYSKCNGGNHA